MSAPTNNTETYSIPTTHGPIKAIIRTEDENSTITLKYSDLANIIENSGKNNWAETKIKIFVEIDSNNPNLTIRSQLPTPDEIIYLSAQQLREMMNTIRL